MVGQWMGALLGLVVGVLGVLASLVEVVGLVVSWAAWLCWMLIGGALVWGVGLACIQC